MSSIFLKISFSETQDFNEDFNAFQYRNKPFSNSSVFCAPIESYKKLAGGEGVNTVYQLNLSSKNIEHNFTPGNAIAILPENDQKEVHELLARLKVEAVQDEKYNLEILTETAKKNSSIPKHLPPNSTLKNIFLRHVDIRAIPKKLFLKNLINYTEDAKDKEELGLICSLAGFKEYAQLVNDHPTLLALLNRFPSCQPPIEVILQHSTPLNPRYFSIASSPLETTSISIIFNVLTFDNGLKGVCTGWLQEMLIKSDYKDMLIPFYFREPSDFQFKNMENPCILIATGTGIAPFRGFLHHMNMLGQSGNTDLPEIWLFYGCRHADKDFLCRDELINYAQHGILSNLCTTFSRDLDKKVYVQQKILENKEGIMNLILHKRATVFACGNPKTVLKGVKEALINIFMADENDRTSAEDIINDLIKSKRYITDTWM